MATNKSPWMLNLGGDEKPLRVLLPVAAGSSQAIKRGEICAFDPSGDVAAPASAATDDDLVVCDQEQKADDPARMIYFIVPRPDDVFEFALDAARAAKLGETFAVSDSQTLTYEVTNVQFRQATDQNYPLPSEESTTRRSVSYVHVTVDEGVSYWAAINGNS